MKIQLLRLTTIVPQIKFTVHAKESDIEEATNIGNELATILVEKGSKSSLINFHNLKSMREYLKAHTG